MTHYIALIHKDADSSYGVSFPDVPGVYTAGDSLDEVIAQAAEVLAFALEDWIELKGRPFPAPRTLDMLRQDNDILARMYEAIVAAIPLGHLTKGVAAE
jgi:antitoxin HicB